MGLSACSLEAIEKNGLVEVKELASRVFQSIHFTDN